MFCHTNHAAPRRGIQRLEARCHLKPYSSVQFSPVQSSCSIRPWGREHQGAARSNTGHWGAPGSAKEPQRTPTSGQLPLFCHTKHTSETKMPYIYLKKHPIKLITLILPLQTHLAAKNALFLPKNTPDQLITLVLPHQPRSSRAPDSTPGGKMSLETLQFSSVQSSSVQLFN